MKAVVTCELTDEGARSLRELGFDVDRTGWGATRQPLDAAEYAGAAAGARLLLTEIETVGAAVLDACADLIAVGTARGGPVNVDIVECSRRGLPVLFTPARNAESVADFVVGLLLGLVRGVVAGERHLRSVGWGVPTRYGEELPYLHFRGPELSRLTVGLVGYGAVGRAVARRLQGGFGTDVLFHDPNVEGSVPLQQLLAQSDVVSLHCPRRPETQRLMRAETFALMKPGSWLVNTAGGACVDEDDLVAALDAGQLAGAALDVFDTEPLPRESPLLRRADVVLTPHLAGAADDVVRHHTEMLVGDVARLLRGERPLHCANPEVLA
ncbi:MAG: NAD(P)-dependent oxidoreductase [Motilibacteraceae bacterium]